MTYVAPHLRGALAAVASRMSVQSKSLLAAIEATHSLPDQAPEATSAVLARMSACFGLAPVDVLILQILLAVDSFPDCCLSLSLLGGQEQLGWPSIGVIDEICTILLPGSPIRDRLSSHGPLVHHGIVFIDGDGPWNTRSVRLGDTAARHLAGDDEVSRELLTCLAEPPTAPGPPDDRFVEAVRRGIRLTWIRSHRAGVAEAAVVASIREAGHEPFVVELARCSEAGSLSAVLAEVTLEASLRGSPILLLHGEIIATARSSALICSILSATVPIFVVAACAWQPAWADIGVYEASTRESVGSSGQEIWSSVAEDLAVPSDDDGTGDWDSLRRLRLTPRQIDYAVRAAAIRAELEQRPLTAAVIRSTVRGLQGLSPVRGNETSLDDLILSDTGRTELDRFVFRAANRHDIRRRSAPLDIGVTALFAGGPGTGKTRAAHLVADALDLPILTVDLASTVDKYIGETEKNLEKMFLAAEQTGAVLLFDEADALFGSRSAVSDSRDRYANLEVSYLLQRIEEFDGISILTTNLRGNLDVAFARRLDFIIKFEDPDPTSRRLIWERYLAPIAVDAGDPPDTATLAEALELTGGEIENVVTAAMFEAHRWNGGRVTMKILASAAQRELAKSKKRSPDSIVRLASQSDLSVRSPWPHRFDALQGRDS